MHDPFVKQILCVMPNIDKRPTTWKEIGKGKFLIINGQYNVVSNKEMLMT